MEIRSSPLIELARRLVTHQAALDNTRVPEACLTVIESLRIYLSKLVGVGAFYTLISRAVHNVKREDPALSFIRIQPDGSLNRTEEMSSPEVTGGLEAIIAHLLQLLVTFVGHNLTLQLMSDVWPDLAFDKSL